LAVDRPTEKQDRLSRPRRIEDDGAFGLDWRIHRILESKPVLFSSSAVVHLRLDAKAIVTVLRNDLADAEMMDHAPAVVLSAVGRIPLDVFDEVGLDDAVLGAARDGVREGRENRNHRAGRAATQVLEPVDETIHLWRSGHNGPRRHLLR